MHLIINGKEIEMSDERAKQGRIIAVLSEK